MALSPVVPRAARVRADAPVMANALLESLDRLRGQAGVRLLQDATITGVRYLAGTRIAMRTVDVIIVPATAEARP